MAFFTDRDQLRSGIPLGGLGTGTLEFFPDGTRGAFTGLNNWISPLGQLHNFRSGPFGDYRAAHPFAIWVNDGERPSACLLQTVPTGGCPTVRAVSIDGMFPTVEAEFKSGDLPVTVRLTAFSPFVPDRAEDSGIPAVHYRFAVHNPTSRPVAAALMASAVNCTGSWNVGRYNKIRRGDGLIGVVFRKDRASQRDERNGSIALLAPDLPGISVCESWPFVLKCFRDLGPADLSVPGWDAFRRDGLLPPGHGDRPLEGEFGEWAAAVARRFDLAPGATETIDFVYAWHAPNHPYGHHYENRYEDAWDAGRDLMARRESLWAATRAWQHDIQQGVPSQWLSDALINGIYPLAAGSWWVKDGRFAELECPTHHPLLGTLDVHYYGSLPLALLFPGLEKSVLRQFAAFQYPDGYIPHDLGKDQLDCPSAGTSAGPRWKDLCPKFALLVYRNYLLWRDEAFLKEMYPALVAAMEWEATADRDGDGLPENEGMDSTFDNWDMCGVTSYVGGIYLAALRAAEECAVIMKDAGFAARCRSRFTTASARFDELLWTGSYYRFMAAGGRNVDDCAACQLNGQWYAHQLGLGYILPAQHVKTAVRTMLDLNASSSPYGAVNSTLPDGRTAPEDELNHQAGNIWPGETYAMAALAIFEGFVEEGLALAERTDRNLADSGCLWNQPDIVRADDGSPFFGDCYERNMSLWTVLPALARHDAHVAALWRRLTERSAKGAEQE